MPVCKFLRRHDTSAPAAGKVYHGWFELGQHLEESDVSYADKALEKHGERWAYAHSPFYAVAYVLDPEFIEHEQSSNVEVMEGFFATTEKIAILLKVRAEADKYKESWLKRKVAIEADPKAQKSWTDYPAYPTAKDADVKEFCKKASAQLSSLTSCSSCTNVVVISSSRRAGGLGAGRFGAKRDHTSEMTERVYSAVR